MKRCVKCDKEKDSSEFYTSNGKPYSHCKKCHYEYQLIRRPVLSVTVERKELAKAGMKRCGKCGEVKPTGLFHKRGRGGFRSDCKECFTGRFRAPLRLARRKAIKEGHIKCTATEQELESAFTGFCHACGVPEIECSKKLAMDHCHETGRFRGWLCNSCNSALGQLKDSSEIITALLLYNERSKLTA